MKPPPCGERRLRLTQAHSALRVPVIDLAGIRFLRRRCLGIAARKKGGGGGGSGWKQTALEVPFSRIPLTFKRAAVLSCVVNSP